MRWIYKTCKYKLFLNIFECLCNRTFKITQMKYSCAKIVWIFFLRLNLIVLVSYLFLFKYLELRFKSHALRLLATSIGMLDYVSGFYYLIFFNILLFCVSEYYLLICLSIMQRQLNVLIFCNKLYGDYTV